MHTTCTDTIRPWANQHTHIWMHFFTVYRNTLKKIHTRLYFVKQTYCWPQWIKYILLLLIIIVIYHEIP